MTFVLQVASRIPIDLIGQIRCRRFALVIQISRRALKPMIGSRSRVESCWPVTGKLIFLTIRDRSDEIQLFVSKSVIGDEGFANVKSLTLATGWV